MDVVKVATASSNPALHPLQSRDCKDFRQPFPKVLLVFQPTPCTHSLRHTRLLQASSDTKILKRFVVTGANQGIGLATVKRLLDSDKTAFVFLGSRDAERGQSAVQSLVAENSEHYSGRVEALQIDVSDAESVSRAADTVRARLRDNSETPSYLAGLLNIAGVLFMGTSPSSFKTTIDVNFRGVVRTTEAFLPLLDPAKGRIISTSSAAGPSFVAKCSSERQDFLTNPKVTYSQITGLVDECLAIVSSGGNSVADKFAAAGLTGAEYNGAYGLTKALVNMYTMHLARENPSLVINSCTPGWIKTSLTAVFEENSNQTLEEMGAKPPSEGAKVLVYLATGDVPGKGWYFGSDSLRSPLDRYRDPGSPAYDGK